jgi:hypothetical protein
MSRFLNALHNHLVTGRPVFEEMRRLQKLAETKTSTQVMSILRTEADKRLVFGWAYQTKDKDDKIIIDRSKGFCETPVLEDAVYEYVLRCRSMGEMHEEKPTEAGGSKEFVMRGRLVESMMFTREKCKALGIPDGIMPEGWFAGFYVDDDKTWERIKRGELPDFSVAGVATSTYLE